MDIKNIKTAELVKKYNFKFSKSLGQNFLIDDSVPRDIVSGAEVCKDDLVIEIGPGVGTLTAQLLNTAKRVVAIELDNDLIPILSQELGDNPNFTLIHNDALKVDFNEIIGDEQSVKLVANLPYYVRKVSPACFIPRPKVDSIVIRLEKLDKPRVEVQNEKLFFDIIRNSFNMRRKTLWNGVKNIGLSKEKLEEAFDEANIDIKRRGETLSIEEFAALADAIYSRMK